MTLQEWLGEDNQLAIDIWHKKYQYQNESFDEWLDRVSGNNEKVKQLIKEKKFLFGGRILSNRGLNKYGEKVTLSNCYVIAPPEDSIESIFECASKLARTYSYGGGCGIDISKLAPRGAKVHNTAKETSGAVSFMDLYSLVTGLIGQNGRRGALMISIDCHHPDIEDFIGIKSDLDRVTKANISIRITNDFMQAVNNHEDFTLSFTREATGEVIEKTVNAYELFKKICEMNWDYAEPGMLFWDRIENWNLLSHDNSFHYAGTNPCAEEPLPAGGSCLLGSINLSEFVKNGFEDTASFDYESFVNAVKISVAALNDVLDEGLPLHPLLEQRESVRDWRQIGLGIMGLADMLIKMKIKYGSMQSIALCDNIGSIMAQTAIDTSAELAKMNGRTYPKYNQCIADSEYFINNTNHAIAEHVYKYGLYNSQLLTIAPTGTLSTMLGISGGIEPIYANFYERKTESLHGTDVYYKVYTPIVKQFMEVHHITDDKDLPEFFVTAQTLDYKNRIDMQSIWQKHIDASISSTVNVPNSFTVEDTMSLYNYAWEKGLKGVTIYRDGCKRSGILSTDSHSGNDSDINPKDLPRGVILKADDNVVGLKRTLNTGCGTLHCIALFDPSTGKLLETYLSKGSTGGCVDADTEYFNGVEWKKISEYKQGSHEKVLQYNENGIAELVEPINYIVNENVEMLKHFHNKYGLDMVLSGDHRMYTYKNYRKFSTGIRTNLTSEIVTVDDYLNRNGSKERHIPTTFKMEQKGIPISDDYIRLLVAIYADGTFDGHKIIVRLKKHRKKERLRNLLEKCDIGWTEKNIYNTDYTYFYIHPIPSIYEWFKDKQFTSKWYECTDDQLSIVIDECVYWDGSCGEGNRLGEFYSSKKEEIDFIQFALHRLGYRASISDNNSGTTDNISYRIRWTKQNVHNLKYAEITYYPTVDGRSYCFTVPSGLLVLRRNNKIFITGNCNNFMIGLSRMISLSARGGIDIHSIVDQLNSTGVCSSYAIRSATKHDTSKGSCCPMAVGNALLDMYNQFKNEYGIDDEDENEELVLSVTDETKTSKKNNHLSSDAKCPQCGEPLVFEGGCNICKSCGWSKCS